MQYDLIRIPASLRFPVKEVLFTKLFCVSVQSAAHATSVLVLPTTKEGSKTCTHGCGNIRLKVEARLNKTIRDVPPNNLLKFSDEDNLFLLGHSDSLALVAGGLGVLTPDAEAPVVTQATVGADLLQTLEVLTKLVVEDVGHHLGSLAVLDVALPVEEPIGDLVLAGVLAREYSIFKGFKQF